MKIEIALIDANPEQPRKEFEQGALDELAESMAANGLLHQVVVERMGERYVLIDGERRLRAARQLGWEAIDGHVRDSQSTADWKAVAALVANVQRADLNPIEEAKSYQRMAELGMSITAIGRRTGINTTRISNRLDLLRLDEEIQDLIIAKHLPHVDGVANAFLSVPDREARVKLARKLAAHRASKKTIAAACSSVKKAIEDEMERSGKAVDRDTPALRRAYKLKQSKWDALAQVGRLPAWEMFTNGVRGACQFCSMGDVADEKICGGCPMVFLVGKLIEGANERA